MEATCQKRTISRSGAREGFGVCVIPNGHEPTEFLSLFEQVRCIDRFKSCAAT